MSMDIHAKPGTKLRFTNTGGYQFERERAAKILSTESVYTLHWSRVDRSTTAIKLLEFSGEEFNSSMFEVIGAPEMLRNGVVVNSELKTIIMTSPDGKYSVALMVEDARNLAAALLRHAALAEKQ